MLVKHLMQAAGDIPGMYDDLAYVISPRGTENRRALLMMAVYTDVFLDSQYENGADGTVFNFDLIYYQNNTNNGQVEGLKIPTGYGHPGVTTLTWRISGMTKSFTAGISRSTTIVLKTTTAG